MSVEKKRLLLVLFELASCAMNHCYNLDELGSFILDDLIVEWRRKDCSDSRVAIGKFREPRNFETRVHFNDE